MKKKILLVTDSGGIHTGLAESTRLVFRYIHENYSDKYELSQLAWFNANLSEQIPWKMYNTNVVQNKGEQTLDPDDRYGKKTFEAVLAQEKPDIVWSSGDLWCFDHMLNSPNRNKFKLALYYTIDGTPYWGGSFDKGVSSEWGKKLSKADEVVVWSEWGKDVLEKSCPEISDKEIKVIYHPADTERFVPLTQEQKMSFRSQMYNPSIPRDAFVMGWIGRNQYRKMNFKMWEVLHYLIYGDYITCNSCGKVTPMEYDHASQAPRDIQNLMMYPEGYDYSYCSHCNSQDVSNGVPRDDIFLWLHMNKSDPGWNPELHSRLWKVEDRCIYTAGLQPSKGLPPDLLSKLMASWDSMLYLSGGEGFGIPAFESLACEVPVVYSNYSSHRDFCKYGGLPVKVDFIPELAFSIHRAIADTGATIAQVNKLYNDRNLGKSLGQAGRQHISQYSIKAIADQWCKLFDELGSTPAPVNGTNKLYLQSV